MEDSRLMNFTLHFWVRYQKFKGATAVSAVIINFFLLLFKIAVLGGILLLLAPHIAANSLLNKQNKGLLAKLLYLILVIPCSVLDSCLILGGLLLAAAGIPCLLDGDLITSAVMGFLGAFISAKALKCLVFLFTRKEDVEDEDVESIDDEVQEEQVVEQEKEQEEEPDPYDDIEDLHFCQLFRIGKEMCLMIDHVEMCPDETAFIRVVDDEGYTPLYKRRVKRDRLGKRFIVFNGTNCYLDDKKTKPTVPKK